MCQSPTEPIERRTEPKPGAPVRSLVRLTPPPRAPRRRDSWSTRLSEGPPCGRRDSTVVVRGMCKNCQRGTPGGRLRAVEPGTERPTSLVTPPETQRGCPASCASRPERSPVGTFFSPPSYTLRRWVRGPGGGGGSAAYFYFPRNYFVWEILKVDSRPPNVPARAHGVGGLDRRPRRRPGYTARSYYPRIRLLPPVSRRPFCL